MKKFTSKAVTKTTEGVSWMKEGVAKIRSKPWAEPGGIALGATASICQGLGNFVPGMGILGGALKMGSTLLNPSPTLADLKRTQEELEEKLSVETGELKSTIEQKLESIREEIAHPQSEMLNDFQSIKEEVQIASKVMASEMQNIERDLKDVKNIVDCTYEMVKDIRYRDGIEKIDGAYQVFLKGSNNLEATIHTLEHFMYELQVLAVQNLNPTRIREYTKEILMTENTNMLTQIYKYVLVVRSKYLQLSCVYFIYKQDSDRVIDEFECFNRDYLEMCKIFKDESGIEFDPGQQPSIKSLSKSPKDKKH